jgi:hypothetical protein
MTEQAKKTSWIAGLQIGLILTLMGIAYSAGLRMSAATSEIRRVDKRVENAEKDTQSVRRDLEKHDAWGKGEHKEFAHHLHQIDLKLTELTQILKRIEGHGHD